MNLISYMYSWPQKIYASKMKCQNIHSFCYLVQYFAYVMDVLLPECVIRIIADVFDVSFSEVRPVVFVYLYECGGTCVL